MKIFVLGDTHGRNKEFLESIMYYERPDMLFHLGDYVEDGEKLSKIIGVPSLIVRGNGDFGSKYQEDEIIELKDKKIFLTHGHKYGVRYGLDNIIYKGMELGVDMILFGHTHIPIDIEEDGIKIMNPGSPSFPRGLFRGKSFGIINIDKKIETKIIEI